jgi:Kinesin motor domain
VCVCFFPTFFNHSLSETIMAARQESKSKAVATAEQESQHLSVRVMARFRPVQKREEKSDSATEFDINYDDNERKVSLRQAASGRPTTERDYTFDKVFGPDATNQYVYDHVAKSIVDDVVKGYNGTVFAYGQTSSGKTYSMFGRMRPEQARGIVPRAVEQLFNDVQLDDEIKQVTIKCSFLEIYKEKIQDLLTGSNKKGLQVRETPRGAVKVVGLTEQYVSTPSDVMKLIGRGMKARVTAETSMNTRSSRSHVVVSLIVTEKLHDNSVRIGKLNLADLAGSERVDKSGLVGSTLSEAKKINQSLSSLGNCINALTSRKRTHVPFRDSKLTYLLKDSLGGNTKTTLLVTCSPHPSNSNETLSTLKFAQRAQHIKNSVRINQQLGVSELEALVARLRKQLANSRQTIRAMKKQKSKPSGLHAEDDYEAGLAELERHTMNGNAAGAAAMYAALGDSILGGQYVEQERMLHMHEKGITEKSGQNKRILDPGEAKALDQYAEAMMFPEMQLGVQESNNFAVSSGDSIMASNSLAIKQRLAMQRSVHGHADSGVSTGAAEADYQATRSMALGDTAFGAIADPHDHQRQTMPGGVRRVGIQHMVHDEDSDDGFDEVPVDDQQFAKERLQQELEAAKQRRENISRRRAELEIGPAAEPEPAERLPHYRSARALNDLRVITDDPDEPEVLDYSPMNSPIPPPPQYPYPVTPQDTPPASPPGNDEVDELAAAVRGLGVDDEYDHKHGDAADQDPDMDLNSVRSLPMRMIRQNHTGQIEYRIDLIPGEDNPTGEIQHLGFIEVSTQSMKISDARNKIDNELDWVPDQYRFTRRGLPISSKQESIKPVGYVSTTDDIICIQML